MRRQISRNCEYLVLNVTYSHLKLFLSSKHMLRSIFFLLGLFDDFIFLSSNTYIIQVQIASLVKLVAYIFYKVYCRKKIKHIL